MSFRLLSIISRTLPAQAFKNLGVNVRESPGSRGSALKIERREREVQREKKKT